MIFSLYLKKINQVVMSRISPILPLFSGILLLSAIVSCAPAAKSVAVQGKITQNTHWTSESTYIIDGSVVVTNGATLTIDPGTLIKAMPGEMPKVSMLVIAQDGKINAKGTANQPIVFTSLDDNITTVNETSMLQASAQGLWGGIVILGDAPLAPESGEESTFYIGLDPSETSSYYGGNNSTHNGGVLEYVSIRHGGAHIGTGNDSNGLTLCAVGSETTLNNIEIFANQDDGVEFFGGTVNASNILVYHQGDDGVDIDEGYAGTIENVKIVLGPSSDSGIEINAGSSSTRFRMANFSLIGDSETESQAILRIGEGASGAIDGLSVSNFSSAAKIHVDSQAVTFTNVSSTEGSLNDRVSGTAKEAVTLKEGAQKADLPNFSWTRSN